MVRLPPRAQPARLRRVLHGLGPRRAVTALALAALAGAAVAVGRERLSRTPESRAYRLLDGEPLPEGLRRVARGRLDHALEELRGQTDSGPAKSVHEARKDLKKLRSLLRLVRREIGDDVYRRENVCFRDAGRRLSGYRDADVVVAALDRLAETPGPDLPPAAVGGLRQALAAERSALQADERGRALAVKEATEALSEARRRVAEWPLERQCWKVPAPGLERAYRRGRRGFRRSEEERSVGNLHEWRKRVKDLWYHLTLLQGAWPGALGALADEAHALSERLGDDHDLALVSDAARHHVSALGGAPELRALETAVARRRSELQAEAFVIARRLYAESPGRFEHRMAGYWDAWRPRSPRAPAQRV
jgi:CHAD domain-containing protein